MLVLEGQYIHTSREKKALETKYFWPIQTYIRAERIPFIYFITEACGPMQVKNATVTYSVYFIAEACGLYTDGECHCDLQCIIHCRSLWPYKGGKCHCHLQQTCCGFRKVCRPNSECYVSWSLLSRTRTHIFVWIYLCWLLQTCMVWHRIKTVSIFRSRRTNKMCR